MKYENVNCIACGKTFTAEDDVVVCPVCGAPHHRACWTASGACAKADAHKDGYVWIFPEEVLKQRKSAEDAENAKPEADGIKLKNGENVVPCPSCGAMCCENDIYCLRCGARLDGSDPAPDDLYDNGADDPDYKELRDDFNRFGGINPDAPVDGIPCWEYAEYVGGGKPGKIIRKVSTMERFGRKTSWNWAALLLGPIWFFWRKMKLEGAVISIIAIFLAALYGIAQLSPAAVKYYKNLMQLPGRIASGEISVSEWQEVQQQYLEEYAQEELAETKTLGRDLAQGALEYLLMCGVPLACALISIPMYRKKVKADIHAIRGRCSNMDEYANTLRAEGGTSPGLCVVGVLLALVALFCAVYLPAFIAVKFM